MRSKYKKKQFEEKIEDLSIPEIIENQTNKRNISFNINSQNNYSLNKDKTPNKFNKINNINDSFKKNMNERLLNKNSSSVSFRKEIKHNNTFNKIFKEKDNKKIFFNEGNENNDIKYENNEEKKNKRSYSFKKVDNYNINREQKELILNRFINKNNSQKNNLKEIYDLTKYNSQKNNTILQNTGINIKEINKFSNGHNNLKELNNIKEINEEENKLFKARLINNIKNIQKFNKIDTVKKLKIENNNINSISRNKNNLIKNIDYFSTKKNKIDNKSINTNNNNNLSTNEKGNSLSVISEKISLLNSFDENSLQKDEKESLKEKKIFSSKNIKDNSELSSINNLENIIEIKEENENLKNEKNYVKNLKNKYIIKNWKKEVKHILNKSIEISKPQIEDDKKDLKNNRSIDELDANFDNYVKIKRNSVNIKDKSQNPFFNISLVNNIKKDNYLYNRRKKNSTNYCSSFRELNENINNINNKTKKNHLNKDSNSNNLEVKSSEILNYDKDLMKRFKKKNINNNSKQSDSYLKIEKDKENSGNNGKMVNKEINININNNYFHQINNYKSENNIIMPLIKKNLSLPIRSFKFLVHQAHHNDIIKDSFNKYYEINKMPNNNNDSLSVSTETNFSNKVKSNNNIYSDILDNSKKGGIKSPVDNKNHFYINNDNFFDEESNNKKRPKISLKQKLIKTSRSESEFFNHIINDTFDNEIGNDKNNINYSLNNRANENNNYNKKIKNEIINNNIYNTTLNIYKINDNNNDDYSQIKSILSPTTINTNILYKNNDKRNNMNIIKFNNNILSNNYNSNKNNKSNYLSSPLSITEDIEIEIFYNLEKKILLLINKIDDYKMCKTECYNYINYYYENKIDEYITKLFKNNHNKINIINYIKIELLCYLLCYDISYSKFFNQAAILIKSIINILNNNFLLIILLLLNNFNKNLSEKNKQISIKEKNIISELKEIIKNNLTVRIDEDNINELYVIQIINNMTKDINNYYKMILDNLYKEYYTIKNTFNNNDYKFPNCIQNSNNNIDKRKAIVLFFFDSYRLLNNFTIIDLKKFFDLFLDRTTNIDIENKGSTHQKNETDKEHNIDALISSTSKNSNSNSKLSTKIKEISAIKNINKINILPDINKKRYKYTLILPFNEMLIHLDKIVNNYMIRPGLYDFLNEIKEIYELIIFTNDNSIYEEQILENFQKEKNIFDYILNKNHGIEDIYYFIQDLNSLNRNIQKFIIIDTTINRFNSFKNNLLMIKPFYGDIRSDKKTLNYLSQLLRNISIDADTTDDIRISLNKNKKSFIYSKLSK